MFTTQFICESLRIPLSPSLTENRQFPVLSSDSRKITPGALFVALPGEQFDGHDFIDQAVKNGATGILCREGTPSASSRSGAQFFEVNDTLEAFRRIATHWRQQFTIPIIAVAGSNGKTTTKELLAAILTGKFKKILKTTGSQNGFIGVPMTLLELRPEHDVAVVEVGIDEIGAMAQHLTVVNPTLSVLTSIGPEHLERLKDLPTVAFEEGMALTYVAEKRGQIALHLDDPWIRPYGRSVHREKMVPFTLALPGSAAFQNYLRDFGFRPEQILAGSFSKDLRALICNGFTLENESFTLPLLGEHNASNLLAAISVAIALGLTADEIRQGLGTFQPAEGRSQLKKMPDKTLVICDYYNANPSSMEAGLDLLHQISVHSHARWACLGDMLEQGPQEELLHRSLHKKLLLHRIENVLLFGERMRWLASELQDRGYTGTLRHFDTRAELGEHLRSHIQPGDSVLIKGSRGMKMEEVWKILDANR